LEGIYIYIGDVFQRAATTVSPGSTNGSGAVVEFDGLSAGDAEIAIDLQIGGGARYIDLGSGFVRCYMMEPGSG
jgi:hypothetical protein